VAFRVLLRAYPGWFRDRYDEEMVQLFRARLARCGGAGDVARLWWGTTGDAVSTAFALRRRGNRDNGGGGLIVDKLWQDIRYAARHLGRSPVFTLGAVAILAIGIGANTTVFTVVDSLLLRPQPWTNPDEVVFVYQDSDDGEPSSSSYPATRDMAGTDVFSAVAAITPANVAWEGPDGPQPASIEYTNSIYMKVLGLSVQRGRWFAPEEDVPGAAPVAVITAPTWHARFGGDPDVVGRTISLNGQPVTIVGVGPEVITGTYTPLLTDFWLSISATMVTGSYQVQNLEFRSDHWYDVRARLAPGVTVQQAQAAMDALAARLAEEFPEYNRGRGITVFSSRDVRLHPSGDGDLYLAGGLLSAVVLTVLLLACANLANLLLVRGLSRSGEMAVRSALGAPRARVARLFLIESLLLSAMGGTAGLLLTRWALAALPSLPLGDVLGGALELGVDARVALFSVGLMLLTGVLFGLAPALRSAGADVAQALRDDRRGSSGGRGTLRLRSLLVAVQVAASLVLVLGTGLLARSLAALQSVDAGVDVDRVAFVRTDWSRAGLEGGEDGRVAIDEMRRRVEAIPGVTWAALATRLPAQNSGTTTTEVEGYTPPAGTDAVELPFAVVSDGYFETMGIPLLTGRLFNDDEVPGTAESSILINEAAARRFYGAANPIGRRMRAQGSQAWNRTVVGVVGDVPVGRLGEAPRPIFYFSTRQTTRLPAYLMARTEGDPGALASALRQAVGEMGVTVSVSAQGTLAGHFGSTLATPRLAARAMGAFSLLALLLAGLGIYAVVSFSVARRTGEMGIRMALGAERSWVVRMIVREVVGVVLVGLVVGLALAGAGATQLGGALYGVSALDPVTFGGAVAVLLLVAWFAAYVPARRAARADPVDALRTS
jgi:putative ABC transport system permease protein